MKAGDVSANNEYDLEHIHYLPYVDVFLTDKRIVDKVKQILRKSDLIKSLKSVKVPTNIPNSLEYLEKALFAD